jgi:ABC-type phosphate transport system permease subunit
MVLCALSIFAIVVLIATELVMRSHLAWSQFGFRFFFSVFVDPDTQLPMYWDPVNGHFSALPFVYGTLVSSFLALLLAVPLAIGLAVFLTEMCPQNAARPAGVSHRVAGGDSERDLWIVGAVRAGAAAAGACESLADQAAGLDGLLQ